MIKKALLPLCMTLTLTACGGGSGSDNKAADTSSQTQANTGTANTQTPEKSDKFAPIVGVYDATFQGNKAVVVISADGKYQVFDDLNDITGSNKDCYAAPSASTPNQKFDGLSFEYDENLRHFKLKDAEPSLAFEVDEDNTLQYIIYGGNITVGSGSLVVGSANKKVVISPEKMTLTEADITAKKCQ
ncbi:hypothetical protein [Pseudoalteromonas sp. R3]|uniref:hypothetical protein n=1 Tax=Pseudoalteromonas sp. R3 TaxID=1709477 RepID=UPI0006B45E38|nr:hypothetical protein [Pseudoalteromonas sp. R3]AZZ99320.1 hypothetical protein ELR70_20910 [Pseudoalteromonas sp. R3]